MAVGGALLVGCGGGTPGLVFGNRLFAVNRDGSGLTRISNGQGGPLFSAPSPPGKLRRTLHGVAWSLPGTRPHKHHVNGFQGPPGYASWSPDGRTVLIGGRRNGSPRFHLFTVPAAGGQPRQITGEVVEGGRPAAWSPDSRWIATTTYNGDIELVRPDGSVAKTLVHLSGGTAPTSNLPLCVLGATCSNSVEIHGLAWSADGRRLMFGAGKLQPET